MAGLIDQPDSTGMDEDISRKWTSETYGEEVASSACRYNLSNWLIMTINDGHAALDF